MRFSVRETGREREPLITLTIIAAPTARHWSARRHRFRLLGATVVAALVVTGLCPSPADAQDSRVDAGVGPNPSQQTGSTFRTDSDAEADSSASPPPGSFENPLRPTTRRGFPILSDLEYWLSLLILALGVIVTIFSGLLLLFRGNRLTANDVLRLSTVALVIIGTLLLVSAGRSEVDVAPATGLFGTIIGYMLGRQGRSGDEDPDKDGARTGSEKKQ